MKREIFLPIWLGFMAKDGPFWLAEDDTPEGHVKNMSKGAIDHQSVVTQIVETQDGRED